jgi:ComF family protein
VGETSPEVLGRLLSPSTLSPHIIGLLPYRHVLVRALIIEAKFHSSKPAYTHLADILEDFLITFEEDRTALSPRQIVLIPIPLSAAREKERGYNQIEEVLKRLRRTSYAHLLKRTLETKPQTSLRRRERLENVIGAFSVTGSIDPSALYIVVDDVTTTGATLNEACETLRRAGATEVYGVALAH